MRAIERALACVGLLFLIFHLTLEPVVMVSESMAPTLNGTSYATGDRVLLEKLSPMLRSPRRWEIYSYYDDEGTPVAKRIVGLPGERISVKNRKVYVNGKEMERPRHLAPARYYPYGNLSNGHEIECVDGYFMLGDSSLDSFDSRFTGVVKKERFRGRVWCVVSPAEHRGMVR